MTDDRFSVIAADSPSDEDMAELERLASETNSVVMLLDLKNAELLRRRAQEANIAAGAWIVRALNLQADVDAGRALVTRTMTILSLKGETQ